jgi:ribose-phosphate pyrophosphokinase
LLILSGSARRVTAVLPLFPYSRQPDVPYKKTGAPSRPSDLQSVPPTPGPGVPQSAGLESKTDMSGLMSKVSLSDHQAGNMSPVKKPVPNGVPARLGNGSSNGTGPGSPLARTYTTHNYENPGLVSTFQAKPGYKQWVAQAGTLVADLLTCAGADHIVSPLLLPKALREKTCTDCGRSHCTYYTRLTCLMLGIVMEWLFANLTTQRST